MIDPRVASGLRDLPPSAAIPRERMLGTFRETFASFGFLPIETPHIERKEVLTGKGAGSEEVLRQIFDVTNTGGTPGELALRFDLTVPLARFIARNVDSLGLPFKRYAIGSVFRGERPAKGRFREFTQCDFDIVGTESPLADAEIAAVIHSALSKAGVPPFTIAINNRKILDGFLASHGLSEKTGAVLRSLDKLAKIGRDKVIEELRRGVVDRPHPITPTSVMPSDQIWTRDPDLEAVGEPTSHLRQTQQEAEPSLGPGLSADQASRLLDFAENGRGGIEVLDLAEAEVGSQTIAAEGIANLRSVWKFLEASAVPIDRIKIDLGLARGLDYYTGVVFETTVNGWERFGSIASGGRYDNLASLFTSRKLPGVGASIGLDRLLALLEEAGLLEKTTSTAPVLIAQFPGTDPSIAVRLGSRLRLAGIGAEVYPDPIAPGKQLGYGSSRGHRLGVIVGPDEQAKETFNLRDLISRSERKAIPWSDLESAVAKALEEASS